MSEMDPGIGDWLEEIGLGSYRELFEKEAIDLSVLPDITEQDLEKFGLPFGDRKRMMRAIRARLAQPASAGPASVTRPEPERRQLTVLQCDMVGSTQLASRLDPEDLRRVMALYTDACVAVVTEFGGHVARFTGDGLMVYFGYPHAFEDAAERAVRAALRLAGAVAALPNDDGATLHLRVGIATGLVVVGDLIGDGSAQEEAVIGETPAIAARLQALAPPDGVVIAESTHRLLGGIFELQPLGLQEIKGLSTPMRAWRALREAPAETRFAASHRDVVPALVGRTGELDHLLARWRAACAGEGQVVLLAGEAGIGKSHLCSALRERLRGQDFNLVYMQCSQFHAASMLHPLITSISRSAGLSPDASPAELFGRLRRYLAVTGDDARETLPLYASLLSIPTEGLYSPLTLPPEEIKQRTLEAMSGRLGRLSRRRPLLCIIEDVHWADPTTLEFVGGWIGRQSEAAALTLVTYRPDFQPPWPLSTSLTALSLGRLSRREAAVVAQRTAGGGLAAEMLDGIVAKAEGIPLFVEELTKAVIETGVPAQLAHDEAMPTRATIPLTLQDSLLARLDRLAPSREVAQIGAAIGREFDDALLAAVAGYDRERLNTALAQLVDSGLLDVRRQLTQAVYVFRHALIQEAAYSTLLRSRRLSLHGRIAVALRDRFPDTAAQQPELLAHHFTEAGVVDQALEWWERAARRAVARSANAEAVDHLRRALALLGHQPASAARDSREFVLRQALAQPLYAIAGYSAPAVEDNYEHLLALGERLGDARAVLGVIWGRAGAALVRCDFPRTLKDVAALTELAERTGEDTWRAAGLRIAAFVAMARGEPIQAREQFEAVMRLFEAAGAADILGDQLLVPGPTTLSQLAVAIQQLGALDEAVAIATRGVAAARASNHHLSACYALYHGAHVAMVARDHAGVIRLIGELVTIMERHRVFFWRSFTEPMLGWAQGRTGALDAGLARMHAASALREAMQVNLWTPFYATCEAELLIAHDRHAEAQGVLDAAETAMAATEQFYAEAETHRLRALALRGTGARAAATAHFKRALKTAHRQGALLWELRAATSWADALCTDGEADAAYALLAPVLSGFGEGYDSIDHRAARDVLARCR